MAEDLGERTEPATERRREEARKRGQFAHSRDLSAAVILLAALVGFQFFGEPMLAEATRLTRYCLQEPWIDLEPSRVRVELARLAGLALLAVAPWTGLIFGAALAIELFQTGGVRFPEEKSFLDFSRVNPISGLGRIFSLRSLIRTLLDVLKTVIVGGVAYMFLSGEMPAFVSMTALGFPTAAGYTFERMLTLGYELVAILLALGIADYAYQLYQQAQDLRMTRQEVKEEAKDIEGDPLIRARRRQLQLKLARQRMIQQVPEAEVVITNPTELAVALKYEVGEMNAPVLIAKGAGLFAEKIRELAEKHQIPIIENKTLARLLFLRTDVGRAIPEESFVAVAEILAYVYQITKKPLPAPRPT